MNEKIVKYGFKTVIRPQIKATKKLNLDGLEGKQIIKSETKLVLLKHKRTFTKLAHM